MKIFVTGATGQLGYAVCRVLCERGIPYCGVSSKELDITDRDAVRQMLRDYRPEAVIHCAAYTDVDQAEDEAEVCWAINASGTQYLAEICREINAKMLYISTDYVFPGTGDVFYKPEDDTNPKNVYGVSKLAGELAVRALLREHFVVRISWVFGENGKNFVKAMVRLARTHAEVNVVCDQIGSPTYTADLAPLLCDMLLTERYGVYHATNEGVCSWADFAREIFRMTQKQVHVNAIPSSAYFVRAERPQNSRLDKGKLEEAGFYRLPNWQDALGRYLEKIDGCP